MLKKKFKKIKIEIKNTMLVRNKRAIIIRLQN